MLPDEYKGAELPAKVMVFAPTTKVPALRVNKSLMVTGPVAVIPLALFIFNLP